MVKRVVSNLELSDAIQTLRANAASGKICLVPTMGYLHQGHLSLVKKALTLSDNVIVSIFVNPTQFNDPKDLDNYPRDIERDIALLEGLKSSLTVWTPTPTDIYPAHYSTAIEVSGLSEAWEGACRPGHFRGVTTVVNRLLNLTQAQIALFGEKDFQQLLIIRRMVEDLASPVEIYSCPIVREDDGLAMSSRNVRIPEKLRSSALKLFAALNKTKNQFVLLKGSGNSAPLKEILLAGDAILRDTPQVIPEYFAVVDPISMKTRETIAYSGDRVIVAAFIGDVRLIDNLQL